MIQTDYAPTERAQDSERLRSLMRLVQHAQRLAEGRRQWRKRALVSYGLLMVSVVVNIALIVVKS